MFGLLLNIAIEYADGAAVADTGNHAGGVGIRGWNQDRSGWQASQSLSASIDDESRDGTGKPVCGDGHEAVL